MADKKRKYTKRNLEYWGNKMNPMEKAQAISSQSKDKEIDQMIKNNVAQRDAGDFEPLMAENFDFSKASRSSIRGASSNALGAQVINNKLATLAQIGSPFLEAQDSYSIAEAIKMCQKAYYGVAVFANSIDIMSEFANTEYFLEGATSTARKFFELWLKKINIENLKQQYFREYFRSGNIFLFRIEGDLDMNGIKRLSTLGEDELKTKKIPVKYTLLNPCDIIADAALGFDKDCYCQILSKLELAKLANPSNSRDRMIFDSLPQDIQRKIKKGEYSDDGLKVTIDASRVMMSFYKKQDYEPFGVPFGYRVLEDIDKKLELKNVDQSIAKSVENAILLITMGESPKQGGLGVNQKNIEAVKRLFQENSTAGRVLVSDYTTEATFVIPDIKKIMNKEKYEILNQDIKEGLQNIIVGKENYSSTQTKAEMFLERLKEARNCFLIDVIQPEIKRLADALGFKKAPKFKFKDLDLKNEDTLMRVTTRLMELGIFTPEQGIEVLNTGEFPDSETLIKKQEKFVEQRKEGSYNPLVGGVPMYENPTLAAPLNPNSAIVNNQGEGQAPNENQKNTTPKTVGRPSKAVASATIEDFQSVLADISKLEDFIIEKATALYGEISDAKRELCKNLCLQVVESNLPEDWMAASESCVENFTRITKLQTKQEIIDLSDEHNLPYYSAALLFHANNKKTV